VDNFPRPPFPEQQQSVPGTTDKMNPPAPITGKTAIKARLERLASPERQESADYRRRFRHRAGLRAEVFMLEGGHDYDGRPIMPFDETAMRAAARDIRAKGTQSVGVASIFSPLDPAHEELAGDILAEECPGTAVTLSHRLGRIGLLERENAALLNAALAGLARDAIAGFRAAIATSGIDAPLHLTQNDGTVMSADMAMALPVMSFASGATNSMRGAAFLSGIQDAMVVDVGGTSTDIGQLRHGFPDPPRPSPTVAQAVADRSEDRQRHSPLGDR
jgi:N-methylhydantoinase A/oxoprolinase/acetone carboxylase beta subunit